MKKVVTYLILAVFCFNIFGASIGEVIHLVIHSFDETRYQFHSYRQNQHPHPHPHREEDYTHEHILESLLETLNISQDQSVFLLLRDLNLLMIGLIGVIYTSTFHLVLLERNIKIVPAKTAYKFNHQEVPTPPPKYFL